MSDVIALLIEISELTDKSDAQWTDDVKVGACKLMQLVLSRNHPMHSFVVHDSRREDCVSISLRMVQLANQANDKLELTRMLREKLQSLTSKLICMSLHADCRAILRHAVDGDVARQSLAQQLQL
jgi:hypothetical protein